ncbi:MAG: hypothetical protein ACKVHR_19605, partial [Pirellulales bacterium]
MRFSSDFSCQRRCSFAVALIYKRVGQAIAIKLGEGAVGQFVLFIAGVCVEISVCKMARKTISVAHGGRTTDTLPRI